MRPTAVLGSAENAVHDVAPWIEKLARLGFLAKALLYMTIGVLATAAALRLGGTATGSRGAMVELLDAPFGNALLAIIAVGLFGYAAWRIIEGVMNPEGEHGAKGIAKRVRSIAVGILHAALGLSAVKLAHGDMSGGSEGGFSQHWMARALSSDAGTLALWGVAAAFVGYGAYQLYKAYKAKLNKRLALGNMAPQTRKWVIAASRFGIAARGIVFGTIGILVARAIQQHDPRQARGVKQALQELFSYGRIPFIIVAVGLIAYGIYELINARYRRISVA